MSLYHHYVPGLNFRTSKTFHMKTRISSSFLLLTAVPASSDAAGNGSHGYIIGGIIAVLIMAYLIYSLIRPEKF